jgi:acetylornithine deacetylase/succinyl-diaminopimelate desuccinylase-like protein
MDQTVDFINVNRDRYVEELKAYLAIPSISALPEHTGDVRRCAEWTAEALRGAGLQNVRLIETPGNPVVYGDWLGAPGAPTPTPAAQAPHRSQIPSSTTSMSPCEPRQGW